MVATPKNPIDGHVGARIKQRRNAIGMSQSELAMHLDITYQQVQKYEGGSNRVGSSRLYEITQILDVSLSSLFEGVEEVINGKDRKKPAKKTKDKALAAAEEFAKTQQGIDVMKAFGSIKDGKVVKELVATVKSVAKAQ